MLQPLTLLEMEVSHRENKGLQYIREYHRAYVYQSIPFDTLKSTISFFLLEVITKAIREHEPNAEMFEFIYEAFCALDTKQKLNPDFHLVFLVNLSRYLGFAPHNNYSHDECYFEMSEGVFITGKETPYVLDKDDSRLLNDLLNESLFANEPLKITRSERRQMMHNLLKYYQLHLENFTLKSPEILEALLD